MRQREEEVGKEKEKVEEEHIGKPNTARVLDERKAPYERHGKKKEKEEGKTHFPQIYSPPLSSSKPKNTLFLLILVGFDRIGGISLEIS